MRVDGEAAIGRAGEVGADIVLSLVVLLDVDREAGGLGMDRGIDAGLALCRRARDVLACVRIMLLTVDCK